MSAILLAGCVVVGVLTLIAFGWVFHLILRGLGGSWKGLAGTFIIVSGLIAVAAGVIHVMYPNLNFVGDDRPAVHPVSPATIAPSISPPPAGAETPIHSIFESDKQTASPAAIRPPAVQPTPAVSDKADANADRYAEIVAHQEKLSRFADAVEQAKKDLEKAKLHAQISREYLEAKREVDELDKQVQKMRADNSTDTELSNRWIQAKAKIARLERENSSVISAASKLASAQSDLEKAK